MARHRHKHVLRTRKSIRRRRMIRVGLPVGAALALANPATGVVWPEQQQVRETPVLRAAAVSVRPTPVPMRVEPISRSATSVRLVEKPPEAADHKFATAPLNVRRKPSEQAPVTEVLSWAEKVGVTGEVQGPWAEVVIGQEAYWVHREYLAEDKPRPEPTPTPTATPSAEPSATPEATTAPATSGLSAATCATGSEVESGLVQNAIDVHRAVCAAFPQVTTYGGVRAGDPGDHGTGHALDIMIPDSSTGDEIAEWVRSHASELGVSYVIWSQHIWSVERDAEGWRLMEDRGSTTANHYDHVHVSVY